MLWNSVLVRHGRAAHLFGFSSQAMYFRFRFMALGLAAQIAQDRGLLKFSFGRSPARHEFELQQRRVFVRAHALARAEPVPVVTAVTPSAFCSRCAAALSHCEPH